MNQYVMASRIHIVAIFTFVDFWIILLNSDMFSTYLEKNQVETRIFYPPIHRLSPYRDKDVKFKIASEISDRGIWLPSSVTLEEKDIEYVCRKIISFSKKNSF